MEHDLGNESYGRIKQQGLGDWHIRVFGVAQENVRDDDGHSE